MDYDVLLVGGVVIAAVAAVFALWSWNDARRRASILEQRRLSLIARADRKAWEALEDIKREAEVGITDDDLEAGAVLHVAQAQTAGTVIANPRRGALREMLTAAMMLPEGERAYATITLDAGGSLSWNQIKAIATGNGIAAC